MDQLLLSEDAGAIRRLTLNRPDKLNALDSDLLDALAEALTAADFAPGVRVVLLAGAGRAFCAGVDTTQFADFADEAAIRAHARRLAGVFAHLAAMTKPVIVAVQGYALGAGCGLVTGCDMAIAAPDAVLGYPETKRGLLPALVAPPLLRAVGPKRAFDLLATGRHLDAREAADLGVITRVSDGDPLREAMALSEALAAAPEKLLPRLKALLRDCGEVPLERGIEIATEANVRHRLEGP